MSRKPETLRAAQHQAIGCCWKGYGDNMKEIWKAIAGYECLYEVSNLGRVKYEGKIQAQVDEIDVKTGKPKIGYLVLEDKNLRRDYVYSMVAFTFLDKIEGDGYHVHHITNNGYDNSIENLVLLNREEHSYVHGFEIGG